MTFYPTLWIFYLLSQLWPAVPQESQMFARGLLHVPDPATTVQSLAAFIGVAVAAVGLSLFAVQRIEYRGKTSQPG